MAFGSIVLRGVVTQRSQYNPESIYPGIIRVNIRLVTSDSPNKIAVACVLAWKEIRATGYPKLVTGLVVQFERNEFTFNSISLYRIVATFVEYQSHLNSKKVPSIRKYRFKRNFKCRS